MLHRPQKSISHTPADDVVGLFTGIVLAGLGMHLFNHSGLITGQTAGAAFIIAYTTGNEFGPIYFTINLPFYLLSWTRMGAVFTIRTMIAVAGLSLFSYFAGDFLPLGETNPLATSVVANIAIAMVLLALVRHCASLGGGGVLAFYLQKRYRIQAGWTQLAIDVVIFGCAFLVIDVSMVAISFLGVTILNVVLALNHRSDRYIAR